MFKTIRSFEAVCVMSVYFTTVLVGSTTGVLSEEAEDYLGEWLHVDPDSDNLTRIVVEESDEGLRVNAFGSCSPADCNWGWVEGTFDGSPLTVVYEQGFVTQTLTMCVAGRNHLFVLVDSVFHDGSGRDFVYEQLFRHIDAPSEDWVDASDFVDTWVSVFPDPPVRGGLRTVWMRRAVIEADGNRLVIESSGECRPDPCNEDWTEGVVELDSALIENRIVATIDVGLGPTPFTFRVIGDDFLFVNGGRRAEVVLRRVDSPEICSRGSVAPPFLRGDSNADGAMTIADATFTLNYLFLGGAQPTCAKSADADDDGIIGLADAVFSLGYLFLAGRRLPEPFEACGVDGTPSDDLSCESFAPCD